HPRVQPSIEITVPRRHQQEVRTQNGVFAAELGKIHVLANLQSPTTRRLVEQHSFIARFFRLYAWQQMMLVVVRFHSPIRRIEAGGIEGGKWRFPNQDQDNRQPCSSRSRRKE